MENRLMNKLHNDILTKSLYHLLSKPIIPMIVFGHGSRLMNISMRKSIKNKKFSVLTFFLC